MAEIPYVPSKTPTVLPAVKERTYDRFWIRRIIIDAENPSDPVVAIAKLHKGRMIDDVTELSPVDEPVYLRIDNVFATASEDADLATAMGALIAYVIKLASQNLENPPESPPSDIESAKESGIGVSSVAG